MAEGTFEQDLMGLFAEPPTLQGQDDFVAAVKARLERNWTFRRWLIGGLGVLGGSLAASQLALASLRLRDLQTATSDLHAFGAHMSVLLSRPATAIGTPAETLYVSLALAVVALALGAGRLVREI